MNKKQERIMRNPKTKPIIFFLSLTFLMGCASRREIVQFKNDTMYLRNQVDALRAENKDLKEMIRELNKTFKAQEEEFQRTRADLLSEMGVIKQQSQFLDNKLDDNIQQMSRTRYQPPLRPGTTPDTSAEKFRFQEGALSSSKLYNNAYKDYIRGNYALAQEGFREFLINFPSSDLADDAQYWIGESFYAQKNYPIAFEEFKILVTRYPDSQKVPAALLKIGYCSLGNNDRGNARKYLNLLIKKFPRSEEARLAKAKLEEMK